jgi:integron integrase
MALLAELRKTLVERNCLKSTSETYCFWVRKFYLYCQKPASSWKGDDIRRWLLSLHHQRYSNCSRKQALNALVFVFRYVLKVDLGNLELPPMPRIRQTLRDIPTREELGQIFSGIRGQARTAAALMYGSGLRVGECCKLRVHDIDLANLTVRIHSGKGDKSRLTVLPALLLPALRRHLAWRKSLHDLDVTQGAGFVELPGRLAIKYKSANRELGWQWFFPSSVIRDQHRWHITDEAIAKQMRAAVQQAGIVRRVTPHTLRHAFATHAMQCGNDPRTVQDLLGHEHLETTMIYLHGDSARGVSPMDAVPLRPLPAAGAFQMLT